MQGTSSATVAVCCLSAPRTSCSSALVAPALLLTIISQAFTAIQFQSDLNRSFLSTEINRSSGSYPNRSARCVENIEVSTSRKLPCVDGLLCCGCFSVWRPPQLLLPSQQPAAARIEALLYSTLASAIPATETSLCQSPKHMKYWCVWRRVCVTVVGGGGFAAVADARRVDCIMCVTCGPLWFDTLLWVSELSFCWE